MKKGKGNKKVIDQPPLDFFSSPRLWYFVVAALAGFLYLNTLQHKYVFDDDVYTTKNRVVQSGVKEWKNIFSKSSVYGFDNTNYGSYRPVTLFTFAAEKEWLGLKPEISHTINLLMYIVVSVLLLSVLRKWNLKWPGIAVIATLFFVAHPIHTEVVANVKSRDELLGFGFFLSALMLFHRYIVNNSVPALITALLLYLLSCFSKENAITFSVLFALIAWFFYGTTLKKTLWAGIPFVFAALVFIAVHSLVLEPIPKSQHMIINNSLYAAENTAQYMATNFTIMLKYFQLLIFPHPLVIDYSYNTFPVVSFSNAKALITFLIHIALFVFAFVRLPKRDPLAFTILFYFITLSITSNFFIKIPATAAERFLFVPSLGWCLALAIIIIKISSQVKKPALIATAVTAAIVLPYAAKTISRNNDWKNNLTLFEAGTKANPESYRMHQYLADELRWKAETSTDENTRKQNFERAIPPYIKSLEIYRDNINTWYNLGVCYLQLGNPEYAFSAFQEASERNPKHVLALNNMGVIHFQKKEYTQAKVYFELAVNADSTFSGGYANLGAIYHNLGQLNAAENAYNRALHFNPNENVRQNLEMLARQKEQLQNMKNN